MKNCLQPTNAEGKKTTIQQQQKEHNRARLDKMRSNKCGMKCKKKKEEETHRHNTICIDIVTLSCKNAASIWNEGVCIYTFGQSDSVAEVKLTRKTTRLSFPCFQYKRGSETFRVFPHFCHWHNPNGFILASTISVTESSKKKNSISVIAVLDRHQSFSYTLIVVERLQLILCITQINFPQALKHQQTQPSNPDCNMDPDHFCQDPRLTSCFSSPCCFPFLLCLRLSASVSLSGRGYLRLLIASTQHLRLIQQTTPLFSPLLTRLLYHYRSYLGSFV